MNKEQLESNLKVIQAELDAEIDRSDMDMVLDKLANLTSLMGLSAECMRYAKEIVLTKQKYVFATAGAHKVQPSLFKVFLEGEAAVELALLVYSDRLNSATTHATDNLRTIISLRKTEMQL